MKTPYERAYRAILSARRMIAFLEEHKLDIDHPLVQSELRVMARHVKNHYDDTPITIEPLDPPGYLHLEGDPNNIDYPGEY